MVMHLKVKLTAFTLLMESQKENLKIVNTWPEWKRAAIMEKREMKEKSTDQCDPKP